eukprot:1162083-Pelagomonas_calceolata.AAC.4
MLTQGKLAPKRTSSQVPNDDAVTAKATATSGCHCESYPGAMRVALSRMKVLFLRMLALLLLVCLSSLSFKLSLGNQRQQTIHQRLSHPHTRAEGAGPAPHCVSKLVANSIALTSQLTAHITSSSKHTSKCPSQLELCISVGSKLEWSAGTAKSPEWALPDPRPSMGIHESMLMNFVSTGAVRGACGGRLGKVKMKSFWNLSSQTLPAAP